MLMRMTDTVEILVGTKIQYQVMQTFMLVMLLLAGCYAWCCISCKERRIMARTANGTCPMASIL